MLFLSAVILRVGVMDQKTVASDFAAVGLKLIDEVMTVKDSNVRSECMKCGAVVTYSYLQVKQRLKRNTGLTGCRRCFKRLSQSEVNRVMLDAGLTPLGLYVGALEPIEFECQECHERSFRRFADIQMGKGCPKCGMRNRTDSRWVSSEEALAQFRAANLEPLEPYPGKSRLPWRSKCLVCSEVVAPTLQVIRKGQGGCKYCGKRSMASKRRRSQEEVEHTFSSAGLTLLSDYKSNRDALLTRCNSCKKTFEIHFKTAQIGLGCPYCNSRRVDPGDAERLMRAHGLEPLEPYPGAPNLKWRCRCLRCANEVTPQYSYAKHGRGLCPHCSRTIVNVEQAIELMLSRGLEPLENFPGSNKPWRCRCEVCGRETSPTYGTIYSKPKGGCKWCADTGIDYAAPSIVYLITHKEFGAHKIGIAAITSTRMNSHKREGWETFKTLATENGYIAKQVEDAVLNWWREERGLAHYLLLEQMPQGGFSETVDASEISLLETWTFAESFHQSLKK